MAIIQSDYAKRLRTPPVPRLHGQVHFELFEYTFAATFDYTADKLELGILPADCRIADAWCISETATQVVDIGIMSGVLGSTDNARTVGDELYDGVALNVAGVRTVNFLDIAALAPSPVHRSIGLIATAANIASGGKVKLGLFYYPASPN